MEPYQPPPKQPSQYDFIMNSQQQRPKRSLLGGGNSFRKTLILIIGGALSIMLILTIALSFLAPGSGSTEKLSQLATEQEEIIRIATIGAEDASSLSARAFAITTKLSIVSQQKDTIAYLESNNVKFTKEQLTAGIDTDIDEQLDIAQDRNKFDETFSKILSSQLATYANNLETAQQSAGNETVRKFLSDSYYSASLLINPEVVSE
ncbi:MAG: hypothetical protein M3Q36_01870 [bacterium]|nr:hypothetical protein [bacterium]